jgi:diguanylate cyclase (GGDEF)-like protein
VFCNKQYSALYGLSPELMQPGVSQQQILDYRTRSGIIPLSAAGDYIKDREAKAGAGARSETVLELADGRTLSVIIRPTPSRGWVTTHEDITDRRRAESQVAHLALHDPLTDLPNRALLRERLETALGRVHAGEQLAVLYLDLDHFKTVNDSLGHQSGDRVLTQLGDYLRIATRPTDAICRYGGEEFLLISHAVRGGAAQVAERLLDGWRATRPLATFSVGYAIHETGVTADVTLEHADLALYEAKRDGRNCVRAFTRQAREAATP